MLFQISTILALVSVSLAQSQGGVMGNTSFAMDGTVCPTGYGPMNVTSGNWATAQRLYGNYTPYAWIASYNGDTYNSACLSFSGNSVNVPASCDTPTVGTLCAPLDTPAATSAAPAASTSATSTTLLSTSSAAAASSPAAKRSLQSWH